MALGLRWCVLVVGVMFLFSGGLQAQPPKDGPPMPKTGKPCVSVNDAMGFKGYTLVAPMNSTKAFLIDMEGRVVHTWECKDTPALSTYLLDNGNLLRPAAMGRGGPGAGGKVQEWSWDGQLLWDHKFEGKNQHPHHDITRLPNGNILMIVADHKTKDEAIAAGRRPETAQSGVTADSIIEVKPTGKNSGEVVWEWHAWDHLVQDNDKSKANFDKISAHPELIDINYGQSMFGKGGDKKDFKDKKDSKDTKVDSGGPGPGGGGPGGLFRSYRYGVDHPAFRGRTLTPGKKIEEIQMAVRQGARTLVQSSSRPADGCRLIANPGKSARFFGRTTL